MLTRVPQLALVYATSNLKINIDIFCRIVAGFVFPGKVLANIWFFDSKFPRQSRLPTRFQPGTLEFD